LSFKALPVGIRLLRWLNVINFGLQVLRNLRGMVFGPDHEVPAPRTAGPAGGSTSRLRHPRRSRPEFLAASVRTDPGRAAEETARTGSGVGPGRLVRWSDPNVIDAKIQRMGRA
jgi:hypothetical protein